MRVKVRKGVIGVIILLIAVVFQIISVPKSVPPQPDVLGDRESGAVVTKVIDGDTLEVNLNGKLEKIRVIGVNTPETVDPRREVECFGREASNKAKELLLGKKIQLESDPTQSERDRYSRLLRYVYLPDKSDFGLEMIKDGFAYEYTYDTPYKNQASYKDAQEKAMKERVGLWGAGCS